MSTRKSRQSRLSNVFGRADVQNVQSTPATPQPVHRSTNNANHVNDVDNFNAQMNSEMVTPIRKPRASFVYAHSPLSTPSLSTTTPFDWEAAKGHRPPPYQTPNTARNRRSRMSVGVGASTDSLDSPELNGFSSPEKKKLKPRNSRMFIRTTWKQWLLSLPSHWWLKLTMLHHDLPLPPAKTGGRMIGIALHLMSALVRWYQITESNRRLSGDGWDSLNVPSLFEDEEEDMGISWTHWTVIFTTILLVLSVSNALSLFTTTKTYDFQLRDEDTKPLGSNATYIPSPMSRRSAEEQGSSNPTIWTFLKYILFGFGRWIAHAWRFLIYHPSTIVHQDATSRRRIQQLETWDPAEGNLVLFQIYSPLHAMLWYFLQPGNWIFVLAIMALTTFQLGATTSAYTQLIKDKALIAAEVMYEYDTRFVNPRLNITKKDASVMTHESEMVDYPGSAQVGRGSRYRNYRDS